VAAMQVAGDDFLCVFSVVQQKAGLEKSGLSKEFNPFGF